MRSLLALAFSAPLLLVAGCSSSPHEGTTGAYDAGPAYPEPEAGVAVTWDTWVSGFSTAYCVDCHGPTASCGGQGCHEPSDPNLYALLFDMRQKASWSERAAMIQCGIAATQSPAWGCDVAPETYPRTGAGHPQPPMPERAIVAAWITAGLP